MREGADTKSKMRIVERIAEVLGYCPYEEVIHRDNLAVISRD